MEYTVALRISIDHPQLGKLADVGMVNATLSGTHILH